MARLFLLRLSPMKKPLVPFTNGGPSLRAQSPMRGSTFITSAPPSPSCIVQKGPESPIVMSRTRYFSSGAVMGALLRVNLLRCEAELLEDFPGVLADGRAE